jgi:hypothetical protein
LSVSHRIWCGCQIRCGLGPGLSCVCVASTPGVLEGMPEGAWPRLHGRVTWSPRTARPWRGRGAARCGARLALVVARVRTQARGSWLPRATAWPCRARGAGIPGPRHDAATEGDGGCGLDDRHGRLLHKSGTRPDGGMGNPKAG